MADLCEKQGEHITPPIYPSGEGCDCDYLQEQIDAKQDRLIAGDNITIQGNTISATGGGASYTAGDGIDITNNVISAEVTQSELDAVDAKTDTAQEDATTALAGVANLEDTKQDKLTAGTNVTIESGVISATDTTYTAGDNITISNGEISADLTDYYTKDETDDLLDAKQDVLTPGVGIAINNNVISSTVDSEVFVPVSTLPDPSTADENKIYLTPRTGGGVQEWHVIDVSGTPTWDLFGEAPIDLSGYYTKSEVDTLLATKQNTLTKQDILDLLEMDIVDISKTDDADGTVTAHVLGYIELEEVEIYARPGTTSTWRATPASSGGITIQKPISLLEGRTTAHLTAETLTIDGVTLPDSYDETAPIVKTETGYKVDFPGTEDWHFRLFGDDGWEAMNLYLIRDTPGESTAVLRNILLTAQ